MQVLLVSILVGVNAWLVSSDIETLNDASAPHVVLALRPLAVLLVLTASSWVGLVALRRLLARQGASLPSGPFLLLILPIAAVLLLGTPLRAVAAPWLFLCVDLRWWLFGALVLIEFLVVDASSHHRWSRRLREVSRLVAARWDADRAFELVLIVALAVPALVASPAERFQSSLTGDEPKYVRFMEN
jgi:hypothetical protein